MDLMNTFLTRVKRKDSTIHVTNLMDEFLALINQDFPDFYQQLIRFPSTFRYSKEMLHETERFPGVATELFQHQRVGRNPRDVDYSLTRWDEAAMAQKAEEEVFNSLAGLPPEILDLPPF